MAVRYYSSLDSGAPVLPSTSGQRFYDNLRLILMACLVNGYDSKPGAGWSVGHDIAGGFSLSNGEGYINFVASGSSSVIIYLMESITDGTTALAGGYNRRSGPWFDGQAETGRHNHYTSSFYGTDANKQWAVVADEKTVTMLINSGATSLDGSVGTGSALHFGNYKPVIGGSGFCALGGNTATSTWPYLASPSMLAGTSLRNPFDGTIAQGAAPGYRAGAITESNLTSLASKKISPAVLRPVRASLMGSGTGISGSTSASYAAHCGLLRGVLSEPSLSDAYLSKVLPVLGVATPGYQDKIRLIPLPNGVQWLPIYPFTGDLGMFVSLDSADWE